MVEEYAYGAFGNQQWDGKDQDDINPFKYCGEYYSIEDDTYSLRNRIYVPQSGRFTSEDPIKNCRNNPIAFVDPFGFERKVVSGGSDRKEKFSYSFIETA